MLQSCFLFLHFPHVVCFGELPLWGPHPCQFYKSTINGLSVEQIAELEGLIKYQEVCFLSTSLQDSTHLC